MAAMAHPAKRARLAPASTPHTQKADALSVITFHLADPAQATKLTELCSFKPEFCHQLFGEDEEVKGWKDPSIDVWLSPITFSCYLDFRHKGKSVFADDVVAKFKEAFPAGFTQDPAEFLQWLKEPGPTLSGQLMAKEATGPLEVRRVKLVDASKKLQALHAHMEPLLLFFVDGASRIDPSDAAWELLVALKEENGLQRVVGFCTLYTFWAYPNKTRLRVSQILVLPPHQRQGVGQALLQAAYALADQRGVLDVQYEEPTEALQAVRERIEVQRMLSCSWLRELAAVRAATLFTRQHAWTGDKLVAAEAKPALKPAFEAPNAGAEVADVGFNMWAAADAHQAEEQELKDVRALALQASEVQRAHQDLRIPPGRIRAGWEALLIRQPDLKESRRVADALRALVKSRLQGASTQAAVLAKRTIERDNDMFVMLKLGVFSMEGAPPVMEEPKEEDDALDAESALEDLVGDRMKVLERLAALQAC